jgi:hypothetical protein
LLGSVRVHGIYTRKWIFGKKFEERRRVPGVSINKYILDLN